MSSITVTHTTPNVQKNSTHITTFFLYEWLIILNGIRDIVNLKKHVISKNMYVTTLIGGCIMYDLRNVSNWKVVIVVLKLTNIIFL